MPTNNTLKALSPDEAGPASRALLERWGRLHLRRTLLGVALDRSSHVQWAALIVGSL